MSSLCPHAVAEAERSVLGALMRDNKFIAKVATVLTSEDFYADAHQKVYSAILVLFDRGRPVDLTTLADLLHGKGQIEDVKYTYLAELLDAAPTAANAMYYAEIVREHATHRAVLYAGQEITRLAAEPAGPADELAVRPVGSADELLDQAQQLIFAISIRRRRSEVVTLRQAINEAYDRLDLIHQRGGRAAGIVTGLVDLDELTGGLQDGELIVVAARPSVGKTSLALAIALRAAESGRGVFFASLEQSRQDLALRMNCAAGKFDHQRARKAELDPSELERFMAVGAELRKLPLYIDDGSPQGPLRIAANARMLKTDRGIGLIVVDYLQMIQPTNPKETRQEQVAGLARCLKQLARELSVPVVAAAQLNRQVEGRGDAKPRLADLRESGAIEADADTVMLLWRPDEKDRSRIEVNLAKQRNGPVGEFTLAFRPDCLRFENYAPDGW
jgi:replicative DNA helicase